MRLFTVMMVLLVILTLVISINQDTFAEESGYLQADLKNGALLYDNWPKMKKADIKDTHPLYPPTSKKSGKPTWRCKECHGWDYIGKDGRYKKGSHFTGIDGIYDEKTEKPQDLFDELTDQKEMHDFSEYRSENDIWNLVKFILGMWRKVGRDVSRTASRVWAGWPKITPKNQFTRSAGDTLVAICRQWSLMPS